MSDADYKLKVELQADLMIEKARLEQELKKLKDILRREEKEMSENQKIEIRIDIDNAKKQIKEISNEIKNTEKEIGSSGSKISGFFKNAFSFSAGALIADGLKSVVNRAKEGVVEIMNLRDNLRMAENAFTGMLGDEHLAKKTLDDLKKFSIDYGKDINEVVENSQKLIAMGVGRDELLPTMKSLYTMSTVLGVEFGRLALNMGQVEAQGYLTGRELRDFVNAGVPLLGTLSEMLGKTTEQIRDMVSDGKITSDMVSEAFTKMTEEGGKFANMMETALETKVSSAWGKLVNNVKMSVVEWGIWDKAGKVIVSTLNSISNAIEPNTSKIDYNGKSVNELTKELEENKKAQEALSDEFANTGSIVDYNRRLQELQAEEKLLTEQLENAYVGMEDIDEMMTWIRENDPNFNLENTRKRIETIGNQADDTRKKLQALIEKRNELNEQMEKERKETASGDRSLIGGGAMVGINEGIANDLNLQIIGLENNYKKLSGVIEEANKAEEKTKKKTPTSGGGGSKKEDDKEKKRQEELIKQAEENAKIRIQLAKDIGRNESEVAKEVEKIQEELEIEILEIKGDTLKIEEKMNKKRQEAIKKEKKGYEDLQKALVDGANDSLKKMDDYKKKIEDVNKKLEDTQKKRQDLRKEQANAIKDLGRELDQLETGHQTALEDRRAELQKQSESGDGFEGREWEEYMKLEQQLTREQKQQAKTRRDMTETEKLLLEYEREKAELQEKMALSQRLANVENPQAVIKQETGDEGKLKTYYEDEKGELIELQNLKSIQYAEDLLQKQNEVLAEKAKLEAERLDYETHLEEETEQYETFKKAREHLEEGFTQKFGEEMQKQEDKAVSVLDTIIAKYKELIRIQHEANMATLQAPLHNAYGGSVPKGRLTVVGENGPEALVARASSYVQPRNAVNTVNNNSSTYNNIAMGGMYFNNVDDMLEELRRRLSMHF